MKAGIYLHYLRNFLSQDADGDANILNSSDIEWGEGELLFPVGQ